MPPQDAESVNAAAHEVLACVRVRACMGVCMREWFCACMSVRVCVCARACLGACVSACLPACEGERERARERE